MAGLAKQHVRVKIRRRADDASRAEENQPVPTSTAEPVNCSRNNSRSPEAAGNFVHPGQSPAETVDLASKEGKNTPKSNRLLNAGESKNSHEEERANSAQVFHPLIPALDEGVQGMRVGGKFRSTAYCVSIHCFADFPSAGV